MRVLLQTRQLNPFQSRPEDVHVKKFLNQRCSESSFCKEEISSLTWYLVKTKGRWMIEDMFLP